MHILKRSFYSLLNKESKMWFLSTWMYPANRKKSTLYFQSKSEECITMTKTNGNEIEIRLTSLNLIRKEKKVQLWSQIATKELLHNTHYKQHCLHKVRTNPGFGSKRILKSQRNEIFACKFMNHCFSIVLRKEKLPLCQIIKAN